MAKLIYRRGPEMPPDIELTRKEWNEFRSNDFIKGMSPLPQKLNTITFGGFKFYVDDDLLGMKDE